MEGERAGQHLITPSHISGEFLKVPRDIFHSKLLYEVIRHRAVLTALGLELALCTYLIHTALKSESAEVRGGVTAVVVVVAPIILLITCILFGVNVGGPLHTATYKLQFLTEVEMMKPGIDMRKWDIIAAKMNAILYQNNSLITPYYYYNGEACYCFFKAEYLLPYLDRKSANSTGEMPLYDLEPYYDQILDAYEERTKKEWQRILLLSSSSESC